MSHNQMSEQAFSLLAEGLASNSRLTDLFFTHNDLQLGGEGGIKVIQSLSNKRDLKSLALNSCNLNGQLLEELMSALEQNTVLKELYLFANKIEPDGAHCISAIIKNKPKLSCIGLSNNRLGADGAIEIAQNGLEGKQELVKISIENNVIGNIGLRAISLALKDCHHLQEFYLYNNEIDDEPITEFTNFISRQRDLFALGLEFNRIGYKGIIPILDSLAHLPKLEKLYLNQNDINSSAAESLFNFVSLVKNLKELRISNNLLEDEGGLKLAEAILLNPQLRVCHVSNNKLSSEVAETFAEVIRKNAQLKDLDLSNNLFIMDELQTLA
jgi:Ran GTPase-activating protein (RanGAP) involved in mRNA processing and transport